MKLKVRPSRHIACDSLLLYMSETTKIMAMDAKSKDVSADYRMSINKDILINHIELNVSEAEKRANGTLNLREYYTVYLIEIKVVEDDFTKVSTKLGTIWRRYTEFEQLRSYLEATYPYLILPPLPEKKSTYSWSKTSGDIMDPEFVERRRSALEVFLRRIASHPLLCYDTLFLGFLQQDEGWKDTCKETGYLQLTESKLKTLASLTSVRYLDERFEAIKDFATELQTNLTNLLRARVKLAEQLFIIYKLHANYGRVFSEWSAIEKQMGDGLQKAGHYMDSLAAGIDSLLEEEELIADQLKEYLFFATSLLAVCKRRDMLQLQLEKAQDLLNSRMNEKEMIIKGKSGLLSRLLGSVDTEEMKESKIGILEQRIQESRNSVQAAQEELSDFTREALADYDRFQDQKKVDLKRTLEQFALLQAKMAKQSHVTWTHIRECLSAIP